MSPLSNLSRQVLPASFGWWRFRMGFQVTDFTLEVPGHVASGHEHRRDLHAA